MKTPTNRLDLPLQNLIRSDQKSFPFSEEKKLRGKERASDFGKGLINLSVFVLALILIVSPVSAGQMVEDMAGREVKIPNQPERLLALGPGMVRKLAYFDAVDRLVGVEEIERESDKYRQPYQLANPELRRKPPAGPAQGGDLELIASRDPDLILYSGDCDEVRRLQERLEIPVLVFKFTDLAEKRDQLRRTLRLLGEVLDKENRATDIIEFIETSVEELESLAAEVAGEAPKIFIGGTSYRGAHGLAAARVPCPLAEFVGGRDVVQENFSNVRLGHVEFSREFLLSADPEYIFLDLLNLDLIKEDLRRHPTYLQLSAFREGKTFGLHPHASYHVNFETVLINSYYVASVLYPEKLDRESFLERADEVYEKFHDKNLYEKMAEIYGSYGELEF